MKYFLLSLLIAVIDKANRKREQEEGFLWLAVWECTVHRDGSGSAAGV